MADAVVVGGGVVGLCAACWLRRAGLEVTVLERAQPGAGASWGNAGWVVPSHSTPLAHPGALGRGLRWMLDPASPLWVRLRPERALWAWVLHFARFCSTAHVQRALPILVHLQRRSLELYEELCARGLAFGFRRSGSLSAYRTEEGFREGLEEARLLTEHGVEAQPLVGRSAVEREPLLREGLAGAVYFPQDAHLDPARLVLELLRWAESEGVRVVAGAGADGLEVDGRRVAVREGGRRHVPEVVVLAAGVWSGQLARTADLRLPLLPAKGYSVTLEHADAQPRCPVMLSEARVAVTPFEDGRLRFAGTLELGAWDTRVSRRRVEAIRRAAEQYLRVRATGGEVWCGLRPCTPDGLPLVGRVRELANLVVATGHGTLGVSLAPATAELVVAAALDGGGEGWEALRPDRFRKD
jgi:D-amino-acid dehydrogenase